MDLRGYGETALGHMEQRALYADRVDWPAARAGVAAAADRALTPADLHAALRTVLREAGGPHSGLSAASRAAPPGAELPAARRVGAAGVLVLPGCSGDPRSVRRYTATGGRALRELGPATRWVVDLRGNSGGSMWPMLAVAAPLLRSDGAVGAFVDRDGVRTPWRVHRRRVGTGRWANARSHGPRQLLGSVAVLTDGRTASSAEAVTVAFRGLPGVRTYGAPTAGLTSSNETIRLPDGALLHVTTARLADRSGVIHENRLVPDVLTADALTAAVAQL